MSDSRVSMTLTLSDEEVRVVCEALESYRLDYSDALIDCDEDDGQDEDFYIAGALLVQLGREPEDWADMDATPIPDPDEEGSDP